MSTSKPRAYSDIQAKIRQVAKSPMHRSPKKKRSRLEGPAFRHPLNYPSALTEGLAFPK